MIICDDNLTTLRQMADNSIDAIVTDPPYGLSFMGRKWDYDVPLVELWAECLRVLKPGGHLLAFAGTRTQHRMAVRIEDAGFEIRDMIAWVYGSGFPKSLDVSKAIDKMAGAEREVVGLKDNKGRVQAEGWRMSDGGADMITAPATDAAKQWDGWGTALKPALEPITLARKPLAERTVAANVLEWGTGGVNVDGCRVEANGDKLGGGMVSMGRPKASEGWDRPWMHDAKVTERKKVEAAAKVAEAEAKGRWPANLVHDGSEEVVGLFPVTTSGGTPFRRPAGIGYHGASGQESVNGNHGDTGSAARFFYCAKASRSEREAGLEGIEKRERQAYGDFQGTPEHAPKQNVQARNHHPTVKPIALMRYLCRLVTPPGGVVLDPFAGSGTTGCAATLEGFGFIGIEREAEYAEIARQRIAYWAAQLSQPSDIDGTGQEKLFPEIG